MWPAGVVPACASLDCLTVFASCVCDGAAVMSVMESADAGDGDVWRRSPPADTAAVMPPSTPPPTTHRFRFGVPGKEFLDFDGAGKHTGVCGVLHIISCSFLAALAYIIACLLS